MSPLFWAFSLGEGVTFRSLKLRVTSSEGHSCESSADIPRHQGRGSLSLKRVLGQGTTVHRTVHPLHGSDLLASHDEFVPYGNSCSRIFTGLVLTEIYKRRL